MAKKISKSHEKELRSAIRDKLNQEFEAQQEAQPSAQDPSAHIQQQSIQQEMEEIALRIYLEEDIYGSFPEFVRCENHLNEVKWFTRDELEDEYEFYSTQETRWERFKNKFSAKKGMPAITNEALISRVDQIRSEIELDAKQRLAELKKLRNTPLKKKTKNLEDKIHQEEIDLFYSKKKGYKKYINHLNETKWMTKEEHKAQDEFIDEVETSSQIWRKRFMYLTGILILLAAVWMSFLLSKGPEAERAYLLISATDSKAQLYIDKVLAAGYSAGIAYPTSVGRHEVSLLRAGFKSNPSHQIVTLSDKDTVSLKFELFENKFGASGYVHIKAPFPDAAVLVNGEFMGVLANADSLALEAGDYTLMLEKPGYVANPPQQTFSLKAGDSVEIGFSLLARKKTDTRQAREQAQETGLLEVRANVPNADIYLDGQLTNFKTDYVLQRIPLGSHIVRVEKQGYKVYPKENVVRLTSDEKYGVVDFTLSNTVRRITLETRPVAGEIFIDNKAVGGGSAQLSLALGKHKIRFGKVNNYRNPVPEEILIEANSPDKLFFDYTLDYQVVFQAGEDLTRLEMGSIQSGYLFEQADFKQSKNTGPELRLNEKIGQQVWMLGYAYQYRNPPGNDALLVNVSVPQNLDLSQTVNLKLWIYQSKDLYPLALSGNAYFSVDVNRFHLKRNALPEFKAEEISEQKFESYPINEFLHPGFNRILIHTTNSTKAHVMLWKIMID